MEVHKEKCAEEYAEEYEYEYDEYDEDDEDGKCIYDEYIVKDGVGIITKVNDLYSFDLIDKDLSLSYSISKKSFISKTADPPLTLLLNTIKQFVFTGITKDLVISREKDSLDKLRKTEVKYDDNLLYYDEDTLLQIKSMIDLCLSDKLYTIINYVYDNKYNLCFACGKCFPFKNNKYRICTSEVCIMRATLINWQNCSIEFLTELGKKMLQSPRGKYLADRFKIIDKNIDSFIHANCPLDMEEIFDVDQINLFLQDDQKLKKGYTKMFKIVNNLHPIALQYEIEKDDRRFYFHGTKSENVYSILCNGLVNMSNSALMSTGAVHGEGIYLGHTISVSHTYGNYIFVCEAKGAIHKSNGIYTLSNESNIVIRYLIVF